MNKQTIEGSPQKINPINILSYDDNGVAIRNVNNIPRIKIPRVMDRGIEPQIYVNDGSHGTNLHYTYSYKVYAEPNEKSNIYNGYSNNFPRQITDTQTYDMKAFNRLYINGDMNGNHLFTNPQLKI